MHPRPILFTGAKGGQGTTTLAAAVAVQSAATRPTVLVDTTGDALCALGHPVTGAATTLTAALAARIPVGPQLAVAALDGPVDTDVLAALTGHGIQVVVDTGTTVIELPAAEPVLRVAVVRNCYLALRRLLSVPADRVVAVLDAGRALDAADVAAIVPHPLTTLTADPAVARTVDAGLLAGRVPRSLTDTATDLLAAARTPGAVHP